MNNSDIAILTKDLTKQFKTRTAVNSLNISIKKGEIFSLLGTNGAGKTTTIKMLCCLLSPTSGSASIMGFDINNNPMKVKELIGVSPQETAIAGHLSTFENLLLMGGIFGLSKSENKKRASELMNMMELEDRKDQSRRLSGGLQRRLSIAMALMSDPQVLFLDEPTLGLDPHARKSVWNYIEKLKGKKTILLTTHYLEEADSLADNIAIMDNSKIIETGTALELKKKYQTEQVLKINSFNFPESALEIIRKEGFNAEKNHSGIIIKGQKLDLYTIVEILKNNNIEISGIEMPEPTLNDVFLQLTGKEGVL
jgi:ABC-2 type transport system ATP-binding protein